jgi:hypothetical protein
MDKYFIIAFVGATFLLTKSRIFKPTREYFSQGSLIVAEFTQCNMCVGFWVGIFGGIVITKELFIILCYGFVTSFLSYISDIVLDKIKKI